MRKNIFIARESEQRVARHLVSGTSAMGDAGGWAPTPERRRQGDGGPALRTDAEAPAAEHRRGLPQAAGPMARMEER